MAFGELSGQGEAWMKEEAVSESSQWWLYILDCDGRLYTGISTDPERRYREHLTGGRRAAKFARSGRRLELKYRVALGSRALAQRAEYRLKKLTRVEKMRIVAEVPDAGALLRELLVDESGAGG